MKVTKSQIRKIIKEQVGSSNEGSSIYLVVARSHAYGAESSFEVHGAFSSPADASNALVSAEGGVQEHRPAEFEVLEVPMGRLSYYAIE